ncbi:MAG: AI-2E family transporter [Bacteroidota bacterium]
MENTSQDIFYQKTAYRLVVLALLITFMVLARELLIPLLIALLFAFLLLPVCARLERWRLPRWLSALLAVSIAVIIFGGLVFFLSTQVISFIEDWPRLQEKAEQKLNTLYSFVREQFNISKREQQDWINKQLENESDTAGKLLVKVFSFTGTFFVNLGLIPLYMFFFLLYRGKLKHFLVAVIRSSEQQHTLRIVQKVTEVSQKYLKGILIDILLLAILASTGYLLLGLQHAILFGVTVALFNLVPYVGVLTGGALPVLMAILTKDEISYALGAAAVSMTVQFLDNNFITPNIVGRSVSINPLTALIALVIFAMIWGIPGMVLSIPLTGMIKVVCDNVEPFKPIGILIGENVDAKRRSKLFRFRRKRAEKK